jgi:hypothetical protein
VENVHLLFFYQDTYCEVIIGGAKMKFVYFNDTGRVVNIPPTTFANGCSASNAPIKPLEEQLFVLPKGTYPFVKM